MALNIKISDPLLRKAVYEAFGGKCFYSNRKLSEDNFAVDHFIPSAKGGKDSTDNYVLCCPKLNGKKSDKLNADSQHFAPTLYLLETIFASQIDDIYQKLVKAKEPRKVKSREERSEAKAKKTNADFKRSFLSFYSTLRMIKFIKAVSVPSDNLSAYAKREEWHTDETYQDLMERVVVLNLGHFRGERDPHKMADSIFKKMRLSLVKGSNFSKSNLISFPNLGVDGELYFEFREIEGLLTSFYQGCEWVVEPVRRAKLIQKLSEIESELLDMKSLKNKTIHSRVEDLIIY